MEGFITPYSASLLLPGKRIAVLAPHPDDEVFGCGGSLHAAVRAGAQISVAILTDGTAWGLGEQAAQQRQQESIAASRLLGYAQPEFWQLSDGELLHETALSQRIRDWLIAQQADLVLTPSLWEMHRDHLACAMATCNAVQQLNEPIRLLMYEIGVPLSCNLLIDISAYKDKKAEAMRCFSSQLALQNYATQIAGLNQYRTYTLPLSTTAAEAFCQLTSNDLTSLLESHQPMAHTLALLAANQQLTACEQTNAQCQVQLATAQHEMSEHIQAIQQMKASLSWRITRPFRFIARMLRGEINFVHAVRLVLVYGFRRLPMPESWKDRLRQQWKGIKTSLRALTESTNNAASADRLLAHRYEQLSNHPLIIRTQLSPPANRPRIDLTMVTFNSERWLADFLASLLEQNYPLSLISLYITDNGSTDHTRALLAELQQTYGDTFSAFKVVHAENKGFGAGHNRAAQLGSSPFILVTNPDLTFEKDSIEQLVIQACFDHEQTVSWEVLQRPYEHPKHYDPVTWETSWSSHACVLIRRAAFEHCGGYDERIFLYGEDVELSYRFRAQGWQLRYCPIAVVNHHTYAEAEEIKPSQYVGSLSAHLYLRLRYGNWRDRLMLPLLILHMLTPSPFRTARRQLIGRILRDVVPHAFRLLSEQKKDPVQGIAPFRALDYELCRMGAFITNLALSSKLPKVSIVTRTVAGRSLLLQQAGISVLQQTYPNIEWIVVEDGGHEQQALMNQFTAQTKVAIHYAPLAKVGRSAAGNHGLSLASGQWCLFLDDDDLLYADHVHCLVQAIQENPHAVAAYALAWEIPSTKLSTGFMQEGRYLVHKAHQQPFDYARLREVNYIPIQAILFKHSLFEQRGGFDESIDYLEDWHLWQRYAHHNQFIYVAKTTSLYRVPADIAAQQSRQALLTGAYHDVKHAAQNAIRDIEKGPTPVNKESIASTT